MDHTVQEVADYLVREYGRSILDDRLGMSEVASTYDLPDTPYTMQALEREVRARLGLPAAEPQ